MKREKKQHDTGKLSKLWPFLVQLHTKHPEAFENEKLLRSYVSQPWPALNDPTKCPNCTENMQIYIVRLDYFNAALLKSMGDLVRERMSSGLDFPAANKINITSSPFSDSVRHHSSQCRTLGLIAKVLNEEKRHDRKSGWLITSRGFEALSGKPVPAVVTVFRNRIEERFDKLITLAEVFAGYNGSDTSSNGYEPERFFEVAGIKAGSML